MSVPANYTVASYAQVATNVLPGRKLVQPYKREVSLKVKPKVDSGIEPTTDGVGDAMVELGLLSNDIHSVYYFANRYFEVEFSSKEGKDRFREIMRKPIARKALECREFDTEFQQIVVTRVPERFPDVNIRTL